MSSPEADLLKVNPTAGLEELKRAYRKAALAHHPDQNPDPHAARHFRRLTEAYRVLSEQAQRREPVRTPKAPSPAQRIDYVLLDLRGLLRRWPEERWNASVDGLPNRVWVAGALEALAAAWPGLPPTSPVSPSLEGLRAAVESWPDRLAGWPLPTPLPKAVTRRLETVLASAEARLRALERSPGRRASDS